MPVDYFHWQISENLVYNIFSPHDCRFCFVQFNSYFSAVTALTANGTEVKGRTITVDWGIPKQEYQGMAEKKRQEEEVEEIEEEEEEDEERVEEMVVERDDVLGDTDEEDLESEGEEESDSETTEAVVHNADNLDEDSISDDEEDDDDSECESSVGGEERRRTMKPARKKPDLDEGRTVFIRFACMKHL